MIIDAAILFVLSGMLSVYGECPYESFTWVSHMEDNPYFWKSPSFDWNSTSILAVFGDVTDTPDRIEMRDYAQSIGVAVVTGMSPSGIDMHDLSQRKQWINDTIQYAIEQGLNGINLDYEGHDPHLTEAYNTLVLEFCDAIHTVIPGSRVSVDVPIYPEYEGRNYDYKRIAAACDSLFIMAYDGEFWDNVQCVESNVNCSFACASLDVVDYGIQQYLARGVPPASLFLGLPWYGLKYEHIAGIPFLTGHMRYSDVLNLMDKAGDDGKLSLDEKSSTWVFDCGGRCSAWDDTLTDHTDTIWFDDPTSLAPKYKLATTYGLRGVGMWESTYVQYDPEKNTPEADAMWDALCQQSMTT